MDIKTTPKHTNPAQPRRDKGQGIWARAPYNFVPLPEQMVVAQEPLPQDRYIGLSGWITCELSTQSPTYIRGLMTETAFEAQGKKRADALTEEEKLARAPFYATEPDNRMEGYPVPVIPGSSLRGMVRSLVEIAAYGRVRWVGSEPTFTFRAVAAARDDPLRRPYEEVMGRYGRNVRAGYLEQRGDEWYILPAITPESIGLPEQSAYLKVKERDISTGAIPGYVRLNSPDYRPGYYEVTFDMEVRRGGRGSFVAIRNVGAPEAGHKHQYHGTLVCSGNMLETNDTGELRRKNHALLFPNDPKAKPLKISSQTVRDYRVGLTPFQEEKLWGNPGCLKHGGPVFYVAEEGEVVAFGHSPNFRVPARLPGEERAATPRDFVPQELMTDPRPDLADALFGWVEEEGSGPPKQRAGRVVFQDAHFVDAESGVWYRPEPIAPHVLSGPKPTTFQHYLVQDREAGHNPDDKVSLAHYGTAPSETQIRGYKRYWHKGADPNITASASEHQHEKQLTRVMPLKPGVTFTFRVRFENLRDEELGALLWALALPGDPDAVYCHKLGMGKPLGMGAVKITPKLFVQDRPARYQKLFGEGSGWHDTAEEAPFAPYIKHFEDYILSQIEIRGGVQRFPELKRIQMLLATLQWREGDEDWLEATRYMEIEYGVDKVNEYKERPVLPDPLVVVAGQPVRASQPSIPRKSTQTPAPSTSSERNVGRVKWFNERRGYGFITPEIGGDDIFVHHSKIVGSGFKILQPGQRVTYTVGKGMKGPEARDVESL